MKILRSLILFLLILSCSSCARIFFGMKKNKLLSSKAITKCAHRYGLPDSYILDSNYHRVSKSLKDKDAAKSLVQPLQFWLYQSDTLVFGMVNCYAYYKFPNLIWPLDSVSASTSPMDIHHYLGYSEHLGLLTGATSNGQNNKKLIIIWSQFLGRQNRHFLRKVHRYLEKNPTVEVSYYNADNIYIHQ